MVTADVAIIGGGMAGLSCATELAKRGISSTVFDKGRGPGGRMATRRVHVGDWEIRFDHGAQYFTARDPAFIAMCGEWRAKGIIAPWPAAGDGALVGSPSMNAPLRHMAETLDVRWGSQVDRISRAGDRWRMIVGERDYDFAKLVVAVPAEQAAVLLRDPAPEIATRAAAIKSDPCWAIMALFDQPLGTAADILRDLHAPISWAARNGAKPGREGVESWVIHGSPHYSREILERSPDEICLMMLAQFFDQAGIKPVDPAHCAAHRWRYARVPSPAGQGMGGLALWDGAMALGVAGDWMAGPRVEAAFLSGRAIAQLIAYDQ